MKKKKVVITSYKCRRCHKIIESNIVKRYCPDCEKIVREAHESRKGSSKRDN